MVWRTVADQLGIPRVDTGPPASELEAKADRSSGTLTVKGPHCGYINAFAGWDELFVFLCHNCGDPVKVIERIQ